MTETLDAQHEDCPLCDSDIPDAYCTLDRELRSEIKEKQAYAENFATLCKELSDLPTSTTSSKGRHPDILDVSREFQEGRIRTVR